MADSTTAITPNVDTDKGRDYYIIKDSEQLVPGGMAALDISTGKIENNDDASNLVPCGRTVGASDGDNTNHLLGSSSANYKATIRGGEKMLVSVTGVTAITDVGKLVYMTDNQTWTLTKPSVGLATGILMEWVSSTYAWVYVFTLEEQLQFGNMGLAQTSYDVLSLGVFGSNSLGGTSAVTLKTLPTSKKHFKIISLHAAPVQYDTGIIAGSQSVNLAIGGTNTTGGVLTLAYTSFDAAGDLGTNIDATAITGANEVHIGDVITVLMADSGTGFTAAKLGLVEIFAIIQYLPGA